MGQLRGAPQIFSPYFVYVLRPLVRGSIVGFRLLQFLERFRDSAIGSTSAFGCETAKHLTPTKSVTPRFFNVFAIRSLRLRFTLFDCFRVIRGQNGDNFESNK